MNKTRIFIAGHNGMVGRAITRVLQHECDVEIIIKTRADLDLTDQQQVKFFFKHSDIDQVYICAAKVGGIHANNSYPAEFIYQNLMINANIVQSSHRAAVAKILFLGSSCIYPKNAAQPMVEETLLSGALEPTNEAYAIAKIAGIKLCESYNRQYGHDYRAVMPANLYGSHDNYHAQNSHVIPALFKKFHQAVQESALRVEIWGSGAVLREFLYVDDLARACVHVMNLPRATLDKIAPPMISHINIGTGKDISIAELARKIALIAGFEGELVFDCSKPEGPKRKLLDCTRVLSTGWAPQVGLHEGLKLAYDWFVENQAGHEG